MLEEYDQPEESSQDKNEQPTTFLTDKLQSIEKAHKSREAAKQKKTVTEKVKRSVRGRSRIHAKDSLQLELIKQESTGRFTKHPIKANSEYPTSLTRLPLFTPTKRGETVHINVRVKSSWGVIEKSGPALNIYDEDTLFGLLQMRSHRVVCQQSNNLPININFRSKEGTAQEYVVHLTQCMLVELNEFLDRGTGGANFEATLKSIERLASANLKIMNFKDRSNKTVRKSRGKVIHLFTVDWDTWGQNGVVFIQWHPEVVRELEKNYTYIDWKIRKNLTDTGKAIHRFLSSQRGYYKIGTKKLREIIGYARPYKYFMSDLRTAMQDLEKAGWVDQYMILHNGKVHPQMLCIERKDSAQKSLHELRGEKGSKALKDYTQQKLLLEGGT
jgi:hypothetical protein